MDSFKYSYKTDKDDNILLNIYSSGYQKCEAGFFVGPKYVHRYLIHHVVQGKGYCTVNFVNSKNKNDPQKTVEKTFEIKKGDTFIMYPNALVSYCADENDPWEYYWVGFGGSDAKSLISQTDFSKENIIISSNNNYRLKDFLLNIYYSIGDKPYNQIRMVGYLYLFLSELVKISTKTKTNTDISAEYVKKAVDYIAEHYADRITVMDIANHLVVSRSHLYRVFIKNLEQTPKEYLEKYRVNQSRIFLERTVMSINEVSNAVGYNDQLHFSKIFKKTMGVSPKEYRKTKNLAVKGLNKSI